MYSCIIFGEGINILALGGCPQKEFFVVLISNSFGPKNFSFQDFVTASKINERYIIVGKGTNKSNIQKEIDGRFSDI